jgi:beta-lactamase class A
MFDGLEAELARIEGASGGRLGVAVLDMQARTGAGHRADKRFPMCSTFKLLAAAGVLSRVDAGQATLERRIVFGAHDLVPYSPATEAHTGEPGMTVEELCEASVTLSDNTAANLLLAELGGPAGLTSFVRTLGDEVTRLDRIEPGLNEAAPGDPRDTTTPAAMLGCIEALTLGSALSAPSRDQLVAWLVGNRTGAKRIRAGLPDGWRVGEKTGSGNRGTANDVGLFWPPGQPPVLLTVYLTESQLSDDGRSAVIADVARTVAARLA